MIQGAAMKPQADCATRAIPGLHLCVDATGRQLNDRARVMLCRANMLSRRFSMIFRPISLPCRRLTRILSEVAQIAISPLRIFAKI